MTSFEIERKTRRFAARMTDRQLRKVQETIEDIRDARLIDSTLERIRAGKERTFSHQEVKAMLDEKAARSGA
jgi:predicted DNA-binding protein